MGRGSVFTVKLWLNEGQSVDLVDEASAEDGAREFDPEELRAKMAMLPLRFAGTNKRAATQEDLETNPRVGASFEGFALEQVVRRLGADWRECHFWRTHQGAELDLLVVRGRTRLGFEFKHTDAPAVTPSMRFALADLKLERLVVVHRGRHSFPMGDRIQAVPIGRVSREVEPLG